MKGPREPLEREAGVRPSPTRRLEDLWNEIRKLEKRIGKGDTGSIHDVPFTLGGPIYVSTSSGYYSPFSLMMMTNVLMSLRTVGTSTTTVQVIRYATSGLETILATVSLAAGVKKIRVSIASGEAFVGDGDELFVKCTVAGVGAQGLDVQCRHRVERA